MPYFGRTSAPAPVYNFGGSQEIINNANQSIMGRSFGATESLGYSVLGGITDLIDSVGTSVIAPLPGNGPERGTFNRFVARSLGMPGLSQYMQQYQGGFEVSSGILSVIGSELIARRVTAPGSVVMGALRKTPYLRRIAVLDEQYAAAMQTVLATRTQLNASGLLGAQQLRAVAQVDGAVFNSATGKMVTTTLSRSARGADLRARGFGALIGLRHAAVTEGVLGLVANQNSFLYDDSAAYNAAFVALGLGAGAGIEAISTGYLLRRQASEEAVTRAISESLDPTGEQSSRLTGFLTGTPGQYDESIDYFGDHFSDEVTQIGLELNALRAAPLEGGISPTALASSRAALETPLLKQQRDAAQKLTMKGLPNDGRVAFSMEAPGFGNHVEHILHNDPMGLNRITALGGLPDGESGQAIVEALPRFIETETRSAQRQIDSIIQNSNKRNRDLTANESMKIAKLQRRVQRLEVLQNRSMHGFIDGELVPSSVLGVYERYTPPKVGPVRLDAEKQFWEVAEDAAHGKGVLVGDNLEFVAPKAGAGLENMDYFDVLAAYRVMNSALDSLARRPDHVINLPKNPNWVQLDMAESLLERTDGQARVMFPKGMTRESAQIESLLQKAKLLKKASDAMPEGVDAATQHQLRVRLNLPKITAYEAGLLGDAASSLDFLLRGLANQGDDTVRAMTLPQIREMLAEARFLHTGVRVSKREAEKLMGDSFRFMLDYKGREMKPLLAIARPMSPGSWTQDALSDRLADRKMKALAQLTGDNADPLSRELTASALQSPDFHLASRPDQLVESQIQGSLTGSVPQGWFGALTKELKPSDWNFRDSPLLLAAGRLRELMGRITRARMKEILEAAFEDNLKLLKNPRNARSVTLLDQFHTARIGWDLESDAVARALPDGSTAYAFVVSATAANRARWLRTYGTEMNEKGEFLRAFNGTEVVLDELGFDIQRRFNLVTDEIVKMQNTILRARGMREIGRQNYYAPPPEITRRYVGWVMGPNGKPVASVIADTADEFGMARAKAMQDVVDQYGNGGIGYTFLTREEITDYASVFDLAEMNMVSPGTTATLPGKKSTGRLGATQARANAFQESLKSLETRILQHGDDVVELLFREQVKAAQARASIAKGAQSQGAGNRFSPSNFRTVHDYYLEALLGRSKSSHPGSIIGGFSRHAEGILDRGLEWAAGPTSAAWRSVMNRLARSSFLFDDSKAAREDFSNLTRELGPYMPFKSAVELGEARMRGVTPPTMAKITGEINRFTAAITLRFLEVAHPVMNLAGILNAAPAVIRNMTPRTGETAEQFSARIGHAAIIFNLPDGKQIGTLDMTKLFNRAVRGAWSRTSHADFDYMMQRGFITQEVAEFHRQFGVITASREFEGLLGSAQQGARTLGRWTTAMSDKSEDFSRSIGHFIGLEVADLLGIVGRDRRHTFAHDVANKMIANYDPHNRAEVFQGAFGSMVGLFQSFAHNYYGRLFRYVEQKDMRAFMTQYATQAALFGITGVTGYQQVSDYINWASDGERRLDAGAHGSFPPIVADFISNGAISQLPRIFGGEAVNLYDRGDTSVRLPGLTPGATPAGLAAMTKIVGGFIEGISAFWKENPGLTSTRMAEILSNMVVNRPLAGMIEQGFANGNDVDQYGQITSETRSGLEAAYRIIGLRSQRQSMELQAYYSDKRAQEISASKQERLRLRTRAALREGREDLLPGIWEEYVAQGGDPRHFRAWIRRNYEAATTTVGQRRLDQLLNDPAAFSDAMRFMDMGVGIEEDEVAGERNLIEAQEPELLPGSQ